MLEFKVVNLVTKEFRSAFVALNSDCQECLLGRSDTADLVLDSIDVSREHAKIMLSTQGYLIQDLNSKAGLYVNGVSVLAGQARLILVGDQFQIGSFLLSVQALQ
ncbi:FHA domain-containing protein [Leptolyngbya sp. AN03gr2]|uniref:FHA domain-containing protein n=1 Tax=unclassified Leptolyngbya TaxID=2650499 RepID=UPI003D3142DC